jgi:hypothetical protein
MTLKAPDFDDDDVQPVLADMPQPIEVSRVELTQALNSMRGADNDRLDSIAMAMEEITREQHEVIMNGDPNEVQPLHQYGVSPLSPNSDVFPIVKPEEDSIIKKAKFFAVMDYYVRAWVKQGEELKKLADEHEQELLADERYDVDIAKITIKVTPQDIAEMKIFLDGYLTDNRLMPKDQIPANISMSRTQTWVGNILVAQQVEAFDTIRRLAEIEAIKAEAGEEITELDRLTGEDARAWKEQIREYIFPASMKSRIKETVATIKNNPAPFVNEYLDEVASLGLLTDQIEHEYNSLISDPEMISEAQMRNLLPAHLKPYLTVLLKPTITARKG